MPRQVRAVELALARGCNILDAVMTRKHERETDLDSKSRDMYIQHHESCVKMYRHFAQILADKEDKRDQLVDTLDTLKYQFEQVSLSPPLTSDHRGTSHFPVPQTALRGITHRDVPCAVWALLRLWVRLILLIRIIVQVPNRGRTVMFSRILACT